MTSQLSSEDKKLIEEQAMNIFNNTKHLLLSMKIVLYDVSSINSEVRKLLKSQLTSKGYKVFELHDCDGPVPVMVISK